MGCELAMHGNMVEITDSTFTPVGGYSWGSTSGSLPKTEIKNKVNPHMPDLAMNESSILHLYLRPRTCYQGSDWYEFIHNIRHQNPNEWETSIPLVVT